MVPLASYRSLQQELSRLAKVSEPVYLYGTKQPGRFVTLVTGNRELSGESTAEERGSDA